MIALYRSDYNSSSGAYDPTLIATYSYDPWGTPTGIYDANGNSISQTADHVAAYNPFRYRYNTSLEGALSMKFIAHNRVITTFLIIALLLTLLSGCTQTYSSLEDAVRNITAHRETVTVLNGIESCMIIYTDKHSKYTKTFAAERNGVYQQVLPQDTNLISHFTARIGGCTIYQIPDTNDFYLIGLCTFSPEGISVEDSLGTDFFTLNTMPEQLISQFNVEEVSYLVCAVLNDFPEGYWISVDGEKVTVPVVAGAPQG